MKITRIIHENKKMEKIMKKQNQKYNIGCSRRMRKLLFSYVDGSISRFNARRFEKHIQKCPKCNEALNISFGAIRLTAGLRENFKKVCEKITDESTAKAKNNLINSLPLQETNVQNITTKKINFKKFVFSFASIGVVFAILIPLAIHSNFFGSKSMNEMGSNRPVIEKNESYIAENDNALKEAIDESTCVSSAFYFLSKDLNEKFNELVIESEYCWQDDSENYIYIGVLLYPSTSIKNYEKSFINIFHESPLQSEIEIISRENRQKLVEYTNEQSATAIIEMAVDLEMDILIISIGR